MSRTEQDSVFLAENDRTKGLVFKAQEIVAPEQRAVGVRLTIWRPTVWRLRPPGKPRKYVLYSLFHFFRVFGTPEFALVSAEIDGKMVGSILLVPAHFKYPFMARGDVQVTYVMVDPQYRGRGIALHLIYHSTKELRGNFWYVTDEANAPSIALAEKAGFRFVGFSRRTGVCFKTVDVECN